MTSTFKAISRIIVVLALGIGSLVVAEYNPNPYTYNQGYNPGLNNYNYNNYNYNPGVYTPRPGTVGPVTRVSTPPYVVPPQTHGTPIVGMPGMGYPGMGYGGYGYGMGMGGYSSYSYTAIRVVRYNSVCFRSCQSRCYRPCMARRPCYSRCGGGFHFSLGLSFGFGRRGGCL